MGGGCGDGRWWVVVAAAVEGGGCGGWRWQRVAEAEVLEAEGGAVSSLYPMYLRRWKVVGGGGSGGGGWWLWRVAVAEGGGGGGVGGGGWRFILTVCSLYPHCILTVSSQYPSKKRCLRSPVAAEGGGW